MENKFERLIGYAQRSLVKNIRKELGEDESLTMGILAFTAFSESFYYESTVKNTLLFPDQIKKRFTEKEIWNYELLFYLGVYMSLAKTKGYIRELIDDNDKLIKKDASFFAIEFDDYKLFQTTWLEWVDTELKFTINDELYEPQRKILTELFYFANYLLTIIKNSAYSTSFDSKTGSFREHIYRMVIDDIKNDEIDNYDKSTGELRPGNDYKWHTVEDNQIKYSELALVLEICFKQPFTVNDKISDLKNILNGTGEKRKQDMEFCAMAKPLQYNGEFQGIIYVTKNLDNGVFEKENFNRFKRSCSDFHIESIIYSSRFEIARTLLENIVETDIDIHPLLKILNCQHLFSNSPLGLIIIPDIGCYLRFREDDFMLTKRTELKSETIFNFLSESFNEDYRNLVRANNYYWQDIDQTKKTVFNNKLCSLFEISEDLFIKSFTCMKFKEKNTECFYFIFSSNHLVHAGASVKQSYALRTHNNVTKLVDTIISAKRMFDIQNNLMNEFQLSFFHDEKNFISAQNKKLKIARHSTGNNKNKQLDLIIADFDLKEQRYTDYVGLLKEQFYDNLKTEIKIKDIENIVEEIRDNINDPKIKLISEINLAETDVVENYVKSLAYLIKEIAMNAVKQYSLYSSKNIKNKTILVRVEKIKDRARNIESFSFYIHNTGTEIPDSIIELAGIERINNGSNSSTGLGFIIMKNFLKRMNAARFGTKYFQIANDKKLPGVSVRFSLPHKITK